MLGLGAALGWAAFALRRVAPPTLRGLLTSFQGDLPAPRPLISAKQVGGLAARHHGPWVTGPSALVTGQAGTAVACAVPAPFLESGMVPLPEGTLLKFILYSKSWSSLEGCSE